MNIEQLERKLLRHLDKKSINEVVGELRYRVSAYNFGNSVIDNLTTYVADLHNGGVKVVDTLRGHIIEDMLDKSYITSRELLCNSNWNIKGIIKVTYTDDGQEIKVHTKKITRSELQEVLTNVIEPQEVTYTVVRENLEKGLVRYAKVHVDLSVFGVMNYVAYKDCIVDAYRHQTGTELLIDDDELHTYRFHIVNYV